MERTTGACDFFQAELFQIREDAPLEPVHAEVLEQALHHVEPGCDGRRDLYVEAPIAAEPALHGGMFMRRVGYCR